MRAPIKGLRETVRNFVLDKGRGGNFFVTGFATQAVSGLPRPRGIVESHRHYGGGLMANIQASRDESAVRLLQLFHCGPLALRREGER